MKRTEGPFHCPVEATLALIGGKYKPLLLWHMIEGPRHYMELQRLPAAPSAGERQAGAAGGAAGDAAQDSILPHCLRPQRYSGADGDVRVGEDVYGRGRPPGRLTFGAAQKPAKSC